MWTLTKALFRLWHGFIKAQASQGKNQLRKAALHFILYTARKRLQPAKKLLTALGKTAAYSENLLEVLKVRMKKDFWTSCHQVYVVSKITLCWKETALCLKQTTFCLILYALQITLEAPVWTAAKVAFDANYHSLIIVWLVIIHGQGRGRVGRGKILVLPRGGYIFFQPWGPIGIFSWVRGVAMGIFLQNERG